MARPSRLIYEAIPYSDPSHEESEVDACLIDMGLTDDLRHEVQQIIDRQAQQLAYSMAAEVVKKIMGRAANISHVGTVLAHALGFRPGESLSRTATELGISRQAMHRLKDELKAAFADWPIETKLRPNQIPKPPDDSGKWVREAAAMKAIGVGTARFALISPYLRKHKQRARGGIVIWYHTDDLMDAKFSQEGERVPPGWVSHRRGGFGPAFERDFKKSKLVDNDKQRLTKPCKKPKRKKSAGRSSK